MTTYLESIPFSEKVSFKDIHGFDLTWHGIGIHKIIPQYIKCNTITALFKTTNQGICGLES